MLLRKSSRYDWEWIIHFYILSPRSCSRLETFLQRNWRQCPRRTWREWPCPFQILGLLEIQIQASSLDYFFVWLISLNNVSLYFTKNNLRCCRQRCKEMPLERPPEGAVYQNCSRRASGGFRVLTVTKSHTMFKKYYSAKISIWMRFGNQCNIADKDRFFSFTISFICRSVGYVWQLKNRKQIVLGWYWSFQGWYSVLFVVYVIFILYVL